MNTTKIEWADAVWNPVTGCTKVSEGCRHCYAETIANRFWGERKFTDVQCHEDRLDAPLHLVKPRRVFVNSMSDLFHSDVPYEFVDEVFRAMSKAQSHTFMILTKRADRMYEYINSCFRRTSGGWYKRADGIKVVSDVWPLPNVWLLVSAENQEAADKRIPYLLNTPAAKRGVSVEPMLENIRLDHLNYKEKWNWDSLTGFQWQDGFVDYQAGTAKLDWVICGGETGTNARPLHPDWVRSLRDQCQTAGVPFFFKQWGEWAPAVFRMDYPTCKPFVFPDGALVMRTGKKVAGRLLDGREWNEYPEVKE